MKGRGDEVYDYDAVRITSEPTVFVVEVERPTLVLGSSQADDVLSDRALATYRVQRRRGGGGIVLTHPGDLWMDFWIPSGDPRADDDVTRTARSVGCWWASALGEFGVDSLDVHDGPLQGPAEFRVACFAGVGSGEVLRHSRKVVGLTQWRVREGSLVSTALLSSSSEPIAEALREPVPGLSGALVHETISSLGLDTVREMLSDAVAMAGGAWIRRQHVVR